MEKERQKKQQLEEKDSVTLGGSLWLSMGEKDFASSRIVLLAKIAECGSITQAAKAVNLSYKAAWDTIDAMNNMAQEPLVERITGGKGGGGTRLTTRGEQLVRNFQLLEFEHRQFLEKLNREHAGINEDYLLLGRIHMKTSARNQFYGEITAIKKGAVNDEIELTIAGTQKITAIITCESTENLGLKVKEKAFAIIKASSVIVMTGGEQAKLSTRNHLPGKISRIQPGAVNTEVVIDSKEGLSVAAIITNHSCEQMGLKVGDEATALFKASNVILGTP